MKKYNFQDLILSEETDVEYYQCSDVDGLIKEMLDALRYVVESGGVLLEGQLYDEIIPIIEKIEKEKDK